MKYWEIIADNLKKRGWSLGYVSAIDSSGRTIWIADAHRGDGKRFVLRADEKLATFMELERRDFIRLRLLSAPSCRPCFHRPPGHCRLQEHKICPQPRPAPTDFSPAI